MTTFLGILATLAGDPVRARQHFDHALRTCEKLAAPLMTALVQIYYARALAADGDRDSALALVDTALPVADAAKAAGLVDRGMRLRKSLRGVGLTELTTLVPRPAGNG